uniref:Uncharacterized protein n=1 Tax=Leersia perrieri TaxID=77586 RepID=A0A0D9XSC8_9ORYZ
MAGGNKLQQQQQAPTSPTASVSESNIVAAPSTTTASADHHPAEAANDALAGLQALRFDGGGDIDDDVEIQSPDIALWESLFADDHHIGAGVSSAADFFMSISSNSPLRDYMVTSSPKRDYMVTSSPKRGGDYMVTSSPKRDFMVTSPRRATISNLYAASYGGLEGGGAAQLQYGKGKSQSPLHKVSHGGGGGGELPSSFMEEAGYNLGLYHHHMPETKTIGGVNGGGGSVVTAPASSSQQQLPTLSECLAMPEPVYRGGGGEEGMAALMPPELYYGGGGFGGEGMVATMQHQMGDSSLHSMLGSVIQSEPEQEQDSGLQLVHLLLACADFVSKGDHPSAVRHLHLLRRVASPLGDSMQRVASHFADALAARLSPSSTPTTAPFPFPPSPETLKVYQILYQACPYIKFAHFTANQAIFEAFHGEDRVHVVDLDILQGYQWPAFLQALAARPGGPPQLLRLTGVGHPAAAVRETGRHLASLAASLRVPFEFHAAVADRLERLRPAALQRRVGEALAVNAVNRLHRVPAAHLPGLLSMVRDQAPKILTLVEQEAGHNGPYFLGRFLEALHYYSAIFDSLDATFPADSAARMKVEQCLLAPEIRNVVACEGAERLARHERLDRWRRLMEGRGFEPVPLSPAAISQSQVLLGLYGAGDGYRLTEDNGCLLLGWQDRSIIAASAWRC